MIVKIEFFMVRKPITTEFKIAVLLLKEIFYNCIQLLYSLDMKIITAENTLFLPNSLFPPQRILLVNRNQGKTPIF